MKVVALATLMLLASANALPTLTEDELRQQRVVTDTIVELINRASQWLQDNGLDPVVIDEARGSYSLSEPEIFSAAAFVEDFYFRGLSNIAINRLNFSILQTRLTFDLSLPELAVGIGASGFEITSFGSEITGSASGSLKIIQIRLVGDVRVSVGVISGISIRSLSLSFSLGGIESNLEINLFGRDLTERVNTILNETVPNAIKDNEDKINELIEAIAWIIIDRIL